MKLIGNAKRIRPLKQPITKKLRPRFALSLLLAVIVTTLSLIPAAVYGLTAVAATPPPGYRTYQGSRYYYDILATRSFGAARQTLYDDLVSAAEALHQDFTTDYPDDIYLTIDLDDYFPRSGTTFDLAVYEAADETVAAFFDDNVQYCFLEKNTGITADFGGYTVSFFAPQPTADFPTIDLRYAADRRAVRDLIDDSFQRYEQLTDGASSRYEIARLVHDKIVSDWDYSSGIVLPPADPNGFSPGAHDLLGGMGYATDGIVCEAYSKTYAFLLNNLGVPAIFVSGDAVASDGFPAGGHAWNIVEMDNGLRYFADLTWADNHRTTQDAGNARNPISYSWFLKGISDGLFEAKHYAGPGSFVGVYERPANMGGADYAYRLLHPEVTFLTDLSADRSMGLNMGTWHLPSTGVPAIVPAYYQTGLLYGIDYELRFEEPLKLGKNRVWFIGKGDYRGMDFGMIELVPTGWSLNLSIELTDPVYKYTGAAILPLPAVYNGTVRLREGTDYSLSYLNNIEHGTGTVVITGLATYAGSRYTKNFQIIGRSEKITVTADQFSQIYPAINNALVVITYNDGSRLAENSHRGALPNIDRSADFYGLPVYYLDGYAEDLTGYSFYQDMLAEFYRGGQYTAIESFPMLG
ncbi:MAG: hypothetical protein LBV33_04020, partial [Lachnospiraceae bacterium]|nr:hypothetical protein [Lachnospiraceae bacterium]